MAFEKPKLFEEDPKNLTFEMALLLQSALMAKLILVNRDLVRRYNGLAEGANGLPDGQALSKQFLHWSDECQRMNSIFEFVLSTKDQRAQAGKSRQISN